MKTAELRQLGDEELRQRLSDAVSELFDLRIKKSTGQLERPMQLRKLRRDIARMRTVARDHGRS